ncbi:serine hydrolase domain-containing protein [Chachezhania antarctica]|uniref:serine hydrolase domain-containing protein n=1 Tax=Chachezhania antarctica TaxID=2340860 RepID=UPI000EB09D8D|nr:serine hydrolase domain-containing protein [Chachezhania antarctica]|tara:strand:- start:4220 stop:5428 length:1209 start_codon:yes stop_codon:yes gene_type:complete
MGFEFSLKLPQAKRAATCGMVLASMLGATAAARADTAEEIRSVARAQFERHSLNALLLEVRIDGEVVLTEAMGDAMTGVPATTEGRFRNGAVALAYVAALALRLAEEGIVDLDEPIAKWMPDLPGSDTATIRMLLNMTAGYPDHVANEAAFVDPFLEDPFKTWTPEDLIAVSLSTPRMFAPGTNWDYSHSGYVIAGQVLEAATGHPVAELMEEYVLGPLDLTGTYGFDTAEIPPPAIHAFTAERGIWEDSTYWNPSWTMPSGAIQVSTISDVARSFDTIVGTDGFLTPGSRAQMIDPVLIGFGTPLPGCPGCHELTEAFSYGLGAKLRGDWVFQTPQFGGYAAAVATLPDERSEAGRITIAVAVTHKRVYIDNWEGNFPNLATETVQLIAEDIHPQNPPPGR